MWTIDIVVLLLFLKLYVLPNIEGVVGHCVVVFFENMFQHLRDEFLSVFMKDQN